MNIDELRSYKAWLKVSPAEVLFSARAFGGWSYVFPGRVPPWASKVRNYFNVLPSSLKLLPKQNAKDLLSADSGPRQTFLANCHEVRTFNDRNRGRPTPLGRAPDVYPVHPSCPVQATKETITMDGWFPTRDALSGDVYLDDHNRAWFQMSAGATIYHWGGPVKSPARQAVAAQAVGQENIPVFKLIHLDGTGGSCEVVIFNHYGGAKGEKGGRATIGDVNKIVDVHNQISRDKIKQGSYNYSETSQVGYNAHELRDVKTHDKGDPDFYSNPKDMHSDLSNRRFPPDDKRGIPLYMQTDWWF